MILRLYRNVFLSTMVGNYNNLKKSIFFRITSLQEIKEKLFSRFMHVFVYPCCLKAFNKSKLKSKVVSIILI